MWGKHLPAEADLSCCQRTAPTGLLKVVNITKYSLRSIVPICLFVVYDWKSRSACRFYFTCLALMSHIDWNCVNGNCESKINPMESILEKDTVLLWGDISGVWKKKSRFSKNGDGNTFSQDTRLTARSPMTDTCRKGLRYFQEVLIKKNHLSIRFGTA